MDALAFMDKYGLTNVIIGLIATFLCGLIKIPIVKNIRAKTEDAKEASQKIRGWCTLIVFGISCICVGILAFVTHNTNWAKIGQDCLLSVACSKLIYAIYEGKYQDGTGTFSLKTWLHKLYESIVAKFKEKPAENTQDVVAILQEALMEETHLPLTDQQIKAIQEAIKKRI